MKRAYLTIDDAPSRDFTAKMEYLAQHHISALLFCEGRFIQQREEALWTAIQRGFLIGNHAFNHPHFSDLSLEACQQEILQTDELIERLYQSAGVARPARYFRFPYFDRGGKNSQELQEFLYALGYRQPKFEGINPQYIADPTVLTGSDVRCTYNQAEYLWDQVRNPGGLSEEAIFARIEADDPSQGFGLNCHDTVDIMLIHDHEATTALFYRIIARYLEKGIQFLPIP